MPRPPRWPAAAVLAAALAAVLPPSHAPAARQASQKVHVLIILDTNSADLREELLESRKAVAGFLEGGIGQEVLVKPYVEVTGQDVTYDRIAARVRALRVGPDDTLFCYIGCHGSSVPEVVGGERVHRHAFKFSGGAEEEFIARDDVRSLLLQPRARLTVLITDTCSSVANLPLRRIMPDEELPLSFGPPPARSAHPVFRKLFLETRGVVDINSSYETEAAWSIGKRGGVFTHALYDTLQRNKDRGDVDWFLFYNTLKGTTERTFREWQQEFVAEHQGRVPPAKQASFERFKSQTRQSTQAFRLDGTGHRLKIVVERQQPRVTEVLPDSPARRRPAADGLLPNDLIVAATVDGIRTGVETGPDLARVIGPPLRRSGPVRLEFEVDRSGQRLKRVVNLP